MGAGPPTRARVMVHGLLAFGTMTGGGCSAIGRSRISAIPGARPRTGRYPDPAGESSRRDRGAPVSVYTVARELGHGSEEMVRRVYAHLGKVRHRSEVVEFRLEQHLEALKDRLGLVGFGTTNDTTERAGARNEEARDTEVSTGDNLPEWARRDSNARPLAPEASALSN